MFEETVERLLAQELTHEVRIEAEAGRWPERLWSAIEENGLTLAAVSEARGGVGGTWHDAFVLIQAAGRHGAPGLLAETIAVNWLLDEVGLDPVAGPATLAIFEGGAEQGRFSGVLRDVPWLEASGHVLLAADGELLLFAVPREIGRSLNIAREPRDAARLEDATPVARAPLGALPGDVVLLAGAMIRSAQIAGGLSRLLDTAVDYANQRVQFGRSIGKFQSIQHQIALLAEHMSLATATAETAFALAATKISPFAVAAAKSVSSEAAGQGAAIAHAVLGAIGFTYEHSLHFTTRRLWAWRSEFGGQTYWAKRIGEGVCRAGGSGFWPQLVAGSVPA
ncbi:MAG: acyl-CoA dehydrogenase family protein [Sphingobium sp.]|nr:acyl-CoA dehydrogenase family protein [Sphingobium sp.]